MEKSRHQRFLFIFNLIRTIFETTAIVIAVVFETTATIIAVVLAVIQIEPIKKLLAISYWLLAIGYWFQKDRQKL
jgi:hypothetical protein